MFNADENKNYDVFNREIKNTKEVVLPIVIPVLKSLDFSSDQDELVIKNMIHRNE